MNDFTIVFYHANCDDGWASRMIAGKYFGDSARYVAIAHHEFDKFNRGGVYWEMVTDYQNRPDIVFVDIVPHPEQVVTLCEYVKSVVVLDHHKTAVEEWDNYKQPLPSNLTTIFKMDKSGTGLAWEYFFPDKELPNLYAYVQDNDLWTHRLDSTQAMIRFVRSHPYDVSVWNFLEDSFERFFMDVRAQALSVEQFFQQTAQDTIRLGVINKKLVIVQLFNSGEDDDSFVPGVPKVYNVSIVNAPRAFCSDIAGDIAGGGPDDFGMTWYINNNGVAVLSFRSKKTGADVAKIGETLGGGGHKHAAGASLPVDSREFQEILKGNQITIYHGPDVSN